MTTNKTTQLVDLDLNGNEIQNAVDQNLGTAPQNPKEGQFYWNSTTKEDMIYNGTYWISRTAQGTAYTAGTGIDITGNTISADTSVLATKSDLANYIPSSEKGANSGVATLGADGKVPTSQLPSFVDDVVDLLELASTAPEHCAIGDKYYNSTSKKIFSATGVDTWASTGEDPEKDKIYVDTSTDSTYRWSGSTMIKISNPIGNATEATAGIAAIATQSDVTTGTNDTKFVTPLKLATHLGTFTKKITAQNGALTASGGVCTWTISNTLNTADVNVSIKEVSTNNEVVTGVTSTASTITITLNSTSNISADTYRAIIVG
jgi:hypothetical protein